MGQSPAAALVYRQGLIDESPSTIEGTIGLDDLLELKGRVPIDARARLAGRVHVTIDDAAPNRPTSRPSSQPTTEPIRSSDGEVTWDAGRGLLRIDAPRAQVACGFLSSGGPLTFGDVTIDSSLPYGAIAVVPLDGQPIARSGRLLVQSMSEQQNAGWRTSGPDGGTQRIESIGTAPVLVRDLAGTVTFRDATTRWRAQALDASGRDDVLPPLVNGRLALPSTRPYIVLTRIVEPTPAGTVDAERRPR